MKYDLCVIGGAGRVGLPLSITFANAGFKTVIFDINEEALVKIQKGVFPFKEDGGKKNLKEALSGGNFFFSNTPEAISQSKNIIFIIGTPVDSYLNPDLRSFHNALESYFDYFKDGQILILRSTVFPGTSEKVQNYFINKNKKVNVAFCPERIVEGKAFDELGSLPQIISAFDSKTLEKVGKIFEKTSKKKAVRLEPMEAELAKLFSNAWRYIKFSVANQFFMMAQDYGLDYYKIYKGMTEDYSRNADLPTPGFAAGPCLFKDTMQLSAFNNNKFFLGHSAMLVNEGLPDFIIQNLKKEVDLKNKTIGILGMAFKSESDDSRDSLSYKLRKASEVCCKDVLCHDFYIKDDSFVEVDDILKKADVIILGTPHKKYKKINIKKYPSKKFVDIWNFWEN
ncbi:MAG: nucleotide sugar dehydrogenase [Candidatus Marinimicrobia bacterium]|nr:nucleotide sugar dehydrogenase [Candidatus Neomarinimicrobiota bacterium]